MVKYGVVGALALAVLVAAMWDSGSPKKPTGKTDDVTVDGTLGAAKPKKDEPVAFAPPVERAKAPEPKPMPEEFAKYEVKGKETLRAIAKKWLHDESKWKDLLEANKDRVIDPEKLHKGLTLVFPVSKMKKDEPKQDETPGQASALTGGLKKDEVKTTEVPAGDRKYVVRQGDTLFAIAKRELGSGARWKDIAKANNLPDDTVRKGQTLILPGK